MAVSASEPDNRPVPANKLPVGADPGHQLGAQRGRVRRPRGRGRRRGGARRADQVGRERGQGGRDAGDPGVQVVAHQQRADRVRELLAGAVRAAGRRAPGAQVLEQGRHVGRRGRLGPGRRDVEQAVVVAAARQGQRPGRARHDAVLVAELLQVLAPGRAGDAAGDLVADLGPGAVAPLPGREEQQAALQVLRGQVLADPVQRVGQRVGQAGALDVVDQLVDVAPQRVHLGPVALVQTPHQHVERGAVLGQLGGDLDADQDVGVVGDLERTGDRVVVRQDHEVHAAALGRRVGVGRVRVGLGHHRPVQEPAAGVGRGPGVEVEVDPGARPRPAARAPPEGIEEGVHQAGSRLAERGLTIVTPPWPFGEPVLPGEDVTFHRRSRRLHPQATPGRVRRSKLSADGHGTPHDRPPTAPGPPPGGGAHPGGLPAAAAAAGTDRPAGRADAGDRPPPRAPRGGAAARMTAGRTRPATGSAARNAG